MIPALAKRLRGGSLARLFLFLPPLSAFSAKAADDFFQSALRLHYSRNVWMTSDTRPSLPLAGIMPGLDAKLLPGGDGLAAAPAMESGFPPVSGSWSLGYENLLRKNGEFSLAHGGWNSALNFRLNASPILEIRSSLERMD